MAAFSQDSYVFVPGYLQQDICNFLCSILAMDEDAYKEPVKRDLMKIFHEDSKENKLPVKDLTSYLSGLNELPASRKSIGEKCTLLINGGNQNPGSNILLPISPPLGENAILINSNTPNTPASKLAGMQLEDSISCEESLFTPPSICKARQSLLPDNLMMFSPAPEGKYLIHRLSIQITTFFISTFRVRYYLIFQKCLASKDS